MMVTRKYLLPDDRILVITVTEEGLIMDAFSGSQLVGTAGMMADEWFEWVSGPQEPHCNHDARGEIKP